MAICNYLKNISKYLFFRSIIYIMELKYLKLTLVPDIFGKNNQFFGHSAYVSSTYSAKQFRDFVKHCTN